MPPADTEQNLNTCSTRQKKNASLHENVITCSRPSHRPSPIPATTSLRNVGLLHTAFLIEPAQGAFFFVDFPQGNFSQHRAEESAAYATWPKLKTANVDPYYFMVEPKVKIKRRTEEASFLFTLNGSCGGADKGMGGVPNHEKIPSAHTLRFFLASQRRFLRVPYVRWICYGCALPRRKRRGQYDGMQKEVVKASTLKIATPVQNASRRSLSTLSSRASEFLGCTFAITRLAF